MSTPIQHLTLLVVAIAGWLQRDQQAAIVYLLEENRVLKARLRRRKLRLTDAERRLLAVKGKALGRELLAEVAGIVTPETLLVWYRTPDCRVDHVWLPRLCDPHGSDVTRFYPHERTEQHIRDRCNELCLLFIHPPAHGSEVSPAARNTLDSARIPRASKLLICGLFQKVRVLAQDGIVIEAVSLTARVTIEGQSVL